MSAILEMAKKMAGAAYSESKIIASIERGLADGDIINVGVGKRAVIAGNTVVLQVEKNDQWQDNNKVALTDAMATQLLAAKAANDGRTAITMGTLR